MDTVGDDAPWGLSAVLANGTRIRLRPILPSDGPKLQQGMAELSPIARRHRFFSAKDELDEQLVTYLTVVDYHSHFAWVAVDVDRLGQPVVAVGRYIRLADHPAAAEIAFVVGDDYQRQGLATMLLDLLGITAEANGIDHFHARVLADNVAMRHVLTAAGAELELDDAGVLRTTMALPPARSFLDAHQVWPSPRAPPPPAAKRAYAAPDGISPERGGTPPSRYGTLGPWRACVRATLAS